MATECTHLDHVHVTQLPEAVDGCEECLRDGARVGAPAHLPGVRARRLLRQLAGQARVAAQRADRPPDHPLAGAGGDLVVVLPRRARDADRRRRGLHADPAVAAGRLRLREREALVAGRRDLVAALPVRADAADVRHEDPRLTGDVGADVPGVGSATSVEPATSSTCATHASSAFGVGSILASRSRAGTRSRRRSSPRAARSRRSCC